MKKKIAFIVYCSLFVQLCTAQTQWPAITQTARPWTRWWWMGSAVDAGNINRLLKEYSTAGFGGVEIVPIYGAKGYEQKYIPYLSAQWMAMLDTTVKAARRLDMGVDASVGTGWPIGGPQVTQNDAATKIQLQTYTVSAGQQLSEKIVVNDPKQKNIAGVSLAAVMAYGDDGTIIDITNKVQQDGTLQWVPEKGNWNLVAAFNAKTLQKVKRAALGGEGYTFDHFSTTALHNYFKRFDTAYGPTAHGVRSFFNDSYEVFGANWSPEFFEAFKQQRGYALKNYLREFNSEENTELVARVKSDYRETMAGLMLDNFSTRFAAWAHSHQALVTNQAHGSPGNLLDLYAAVDIAETETFGSTKFDISGLRRDSADKQNLDPDPVMSKFASSAAHVTGHNLTSCETFTWLTEHFKTAWSQCKPEVENVFLSGINHVFFHGTTYSPAEAVWPGWLFYASTNTVPANSMWPQLDGLTNYIARCQAVLQAGKPDNDLLLYWPVYDIWNNAKGKDKPLKVHDINEWLQPTAFYRTTKALEQKGYTVDFVSDRMIAQSYTNTTGLHITDSGGVYKALVVPACELIPLVTLYKLKALAENGAAIIFEALPKDVPGLAELDSRRKAFQQFWATLPAAVIKNGCKIIPVGKGSIAISNNVAAALHLQGINEEAIAGTGLQFIRRKIPNGKYYFITNHTANAIDTSIALQVTAATVIVLDPQTGKEGTAAIRMQNGQPVVRLQLLSGEAWILKVLNNAVAKTQPWHYSNKTLPPVNITSNWTVSFTKGGPQLPQARTISSLSSWTDWGDTSLQNFSGTAVYNTTVELKEKTAADYILNLGRVCESAKVWVNGKLAGTAWSIPYRLSIGSLLRKGRNEIKIEVVNLMANRIRYMDRNKISWRNYHEINFVNNNYKDFDASGWAPQPSGLLGPVTIEPVQF